MGDIDDRIEAVRVATQARLDQVTAPMSNEQVIRYRDLISQCTNAWFEALQHERVEVNDKDVIRALVISLHLLEQIMEDNPSSPPREQIFLAKISALAVHAGLT